MNKPPTYRPKRHLRNELYSLAAVMSAPLAVVLAFPYSAIGFAAKEPAPRRACVCAFVKLAQGVAEASVATAQSAMLTAKPRHTQTMRAELSLSDISEVQIPAVSVAAPSLGTGDAFAEYRDVPLPKTLAAPKAQKLNPPEEKTEPKRPAFPREELIAQVIPNFETKGQIQR